MVRTELLQEVRAMRFEEIHDRFRRGRLSASEAAEWLGMSERTFRRYRGRYETEGAAGLLDRRLGKVGLSRIGVDEVERIVALYRDRYAGWTVKHFFERAVDKHALTASYGWTKSVLQAVGLVRPAPKRSSAPQEASSPAAAGADAAPGRLAASVAAAAGPPDRPDRDDGRCDERDLFGLPGGRGRNGEHVPGAARGDRRPRPVLLALHRPRLALLPDAGGRRQGLADAADPGRPGARPARHSAHPGLLARGPRPLGAHVRHASGPADEGAGRCRHHHDQRRQPVHPGGLLLAHNRRFAIEATEPGTALLPWTGGALAEILCHQEGVVGNDNTIVSGRLRLQIEPSPLRPHFVKATVQVRRYLDDTLAIFYGPRCIGRFGPDGVARATHQQAA